MDGARIEGRWAVRFSSDDQPAVGVFVREGDAGVQGTFLTATGDYRYLAGRFEGGRLRLSAFDGAHAFLFDARMGDDGTLAGDFWSRDTWHETWTARREPKADIPDPFAATRAAERADLAAAVYPDLDGRPRALSDPELDGAARLIVVFGSWCPNCNDATDDLVDLHRRYRARGLQIVGVAFELTGAFEQDVERVRAYARHHGIEYPLLIGGTSDKEAASTAFPLVDRVRAFPTVLFVDADDRIRWVYTGYSGPATGPAHERLRAEFERRVDTLLAEAGAGAG